MLTVNYGLFLSLAALLFSKYLSFSKTSIVALNSLILIVFVSIFGLARHKFFYTLGQEQNISFIYMIVFASLVAISTRKEKSYSLAFSSCCFLLAAFFVSEVVMLLPIVRMYLDYTLLQHEKVETKLTDIFYYRILANICEIVLLYLLTSFEFSHHATQILSLGIYFIFVIQMLLSYYFEKCFRESFTPLRIMVNFVNYLLYPGWVLMLMREVKCVDILTPLALLILVIGVLVILVDVYNTKKSMCGILVINIFIFLCPVKGNEYIFYKLSSFSFMTGLLLYWTEDILAFSPATSRFGKILRYIFAILVAMPILGNGNLTKLIILLRLHNEYLSIYLVILFALMGIQAFYRYNNTPRSSQVLIKNFRPFWIIIVSNVLVTIWLNLSLLVNAKV
ncbi:MAG: hypothetical protein A2X86_05210 [Bdellovibrionales bacterium GWA2_49_15]|nr:MAG: hypothetical protein A2X86_05210 [Bdellovibrionales bacterium GWA2_49_15]